MAMVNKRDSIRGVVKIWDTTTGIRQLISKA